MVLGYLNGNPRFYHSVSDSRHIFGIIGRIAALPGRSANTPLRAIRSWFWPACRSNIVIFWLVCLMFVVLMISVEFIPHATQIWGLGERKIQSVRNEHSYFRFSSFGCCSCIRHAACGMRHLACGLFRLCLGYYELL